MGMKQGKCEIRLEAAELTLSEEDGKTILRATEPPFFVEIELIDRQVLDLFERSAKYAYE